MSKLYIHETDYQGQGCVVYENKIKYYGYGDKIDMKIAIEKLIDIGFINPEDVEII